MSGPVKKRIFQPKDVVLFRAPIQTCGANPERFSIFSIPTPSARLLTKVAFFFWPQITGQFTPLVSPPAGPIDPYQSGALAYHLQLYTAEQAETGWLIPTGDLVGTLASLAGGQSIPTMAPSTGISGFSLDVQGGQDAIGGLMLYAATAGYSAPTFTGINLTLRVRYEVVGSDMCEDEWSDLKQKLQIQAAAPVVFT